MAYSTCHECNLSFHVPDHAVDPGMCPQCAKAMVWLVPPSPIPAEVDSGPERSEPSAQTSHGGSPVTSDLDEDDTILDSQDVDNQPTNQYTHAQTRDSATKKLDSSNLPYDEPSLNAADDFSLFTDVQPQLPKLSAPDSVYELPRTADSKNAPGVSLSSMFIWVMASTVLGGLIAYLINQ